MASETALGFIAVAISIVFFGSNTVPFVYSNNKYKGKGELHPLCYQLYLSFFIFFCGCLCLTVATFKFDVYGLMSACLWVPANLCAMVAVDAVGQGVGMGGWSGVSMFVSFIWGAGLVPLLPNLPPGAEGDGVKSLGLSIVALVILSVGVLGVALCNHPFVTGLLDKYVHKTAPGSVADESQKASFMEEGTDQTSSEDEEDEQEEVEEEEEEEGESSSEESTESSTASLSRAGSKKSSKTPAKSAGKGAGQTTTDRKGVQKESSHEEDTEESQLVAKAGDGGVPPPRKPLYVRGVIAIFGVGIFNGSMLVPTVYSEAKGLDFIWTFSLGTVFVSALAFFFFFGVIKREMPEMYFKRTVPFALATGIIWSIGNIGAVYAVEYLGLGIGFPLVQASLIVSGLWGIFVFKEIPRTDSIVIFFVFALVILAGAAVLSVFG